MVLAEWEVLEVMSENVRHPTSYVTEFGWFVRPPEACSRELTRGSDDALRGYQSSIASRRT